VQITLQKNENCWYKVECTLNELKNVTVDRRQGIKEDRLFMLDEGELFLTNKRLVFVGKKKTISLKHEAIIAETIYTNGFSVAKNSGKLIFFSFSEGLEDFIILYDRSRNGHTDVNVEEEQTNEEEKPRIDIKSNEWKELSDNFIQFSKVTSSWLESREAKIYYEFDSHTKPEMAEIAKSDFRQYIEELNNRKKQLQQKYQDLIHVIDKLNPVVKQEILKKYIPELHNVHDDLYNALDSQVIKKKQWIVEIDNWLSNHSEGYASGKIEQPKVVKDQNQTSKETSEKKTSESLESLLAELNQ
jgi:hypothetical protein